MIKNLERGKVCALSGHRKLFPNFDQNELYYQLEELIQRGYDHFLCGMALGFDLTALEKLVALKQTYSISLEACIPFPNQEKNFSKEEKERYEILLSWCDQKTIVCDHYFKGCFLARNRYMVDCCDLLFAYYKQDEGGTAYTVKYAKERRKEILFYK